MSDTTLINLHITGFGPFLNVVKNPSSTIMNLVADYFKSKLENNNNNKEEPKVIVQIASTTELEVSVQRVEQYIGEMMTTTKSNTKSNHHQQQMKKIINFFLHFGINRGAKKTIAVEVEAENCVLIPPNDHSKFDSYYCAEIFHKKGTTPKNNDNDSAPSSNSSCSSSSDQEDDENSKDDDQSFKADSAAATESDDNKKKKPTTAAPSSPSSSLQIRHKSRIVSCLCPTKLRQITEELLLVASHGLSDSVPNQLYFTEAAQIANKTADERAVLSVPEFYNLAPSTDAGKYLCNFIFYMSLLKLSLRNTTEKIREMKMKYANRETLKRFVALKRHTPSFLSSFGLNTTTIETADNDENNNNNHTNTENHSLFIHVLDPLRVTEKNQVELICKFLEKLFDRLQ